ncbi:MAG TPA: hypothetical protein PK280_08925 [Planctomycetota bacterium]|nr:hypothetical protein [Planctomycetota bacterium]
MKKFIAGLCAAGLALALVGCSGGDSTPVKPADPKKPADGTKPPATAPATPAPATPAPATPAPVVPEKK